MTCSFFAKVHSLQFLLLNHIELICFPTHFQRRNSIDNKIQSNLNINLILDFSFEASLHELRLRSSSKIHWSSKGSHRNSRHPLCKVLPSSHHMFCWWIALFQHEFTKFGVHFLPSCFYSRWSTGYVTPIIDTKHVPAGISTTDS